MKTDILIIGRNEEILNTLSRVINKNENWQAIVALTDYEAIQYFNNNKVDIVLLSSGIEEDNEQTLRDNFMSINSSAIVIQHYGGGGGLLNNEIKHALENRN